MSTIVYEINIVDFDRFELSKKFMQKNFYYPK